MSTSTAQVDAFVAVDDPDLLCACWDGLALIDAGWRPRRITYSAGSGVGSLAVATPGGRVVTIAYQPAVLSRDVMRESLPEGRCAKLALRLVAAVARLRERGGEGLEYLGRYLTAHCRSASRGVVCRGRDDAIPDPVLYAQPQALRVAFWLLAILVCDMGWRVTDIGDEAACGGFVADIPGEVAAIFPAGMSRDGTLGAELACALAGLESAGLGYLRRQTVLTLSRAKAAIGQATS